jgi:hypothetical protein
MIYIFINDQNHLGYGKQVSIFENLFGALMLKQDYVKGPWGLKWSDNST